jgi:hypothetical protein
MASNLGWIQSGNGNGVGFHGVLDRIAGEGHCPRRRVAQTESISRLHTLPCHPPSPNLMSQPGQAEHHNSTCKCMLQIPNPTSQKRRHTPTLGRVPDLNKVNDHIPLSEYTQRRWFILDVHSHLVFLVPLASIPEVSLQDAGRSHC